MRRWASFGTPRTLPTRTFCTWPFEQRRISATSLMVRMFDVFSMCPSALHAPAGTGCDAPLIQHLHPRQPTGLGAQFLRHSRGAPAFKNLFRPRLVVRAKDAGTGSRGSVFWGTFSTPAC